MKRTPLHELHCRLGAKMTSFAGWELPLQYRGILEEHLHTRSRASLFDVSHMGQVQVQGAGSGAALETLLPRTCRGVRQARHAIPSSLARWRHCGRPAAAVYRRGQLLLVVNAVQLDADLALLKAALPAGVQVQCLAGEAMLALQGPEAAAVMERCCPGSSALCFMEVKSLEIAGLACLVSRSGYTGEDGFEISLSSQRAVAAAEALLAAPGIAPAGLAHGILCALKQGCACMAGTSMSAPLRWRQPWNGAFPRYGVPGESVQAAFPERR